MGLPEKLYTGMLEVGYCAHYNKIRGPDVAQRSLSLWCLDERADRFFSSDALLNVN